MRVGREDADCEWMENMQILPGSSNNEGFIAAMWRFRKVPALALRGALATKQSSSSFQAPGLPRRKSSSQ
jgi:hypothetical protein